MVEQATPDNATPAWSSSAPPEVIAYEEAQGFGDDSLIPKLDDKPPEGTGEHEEVGDSPYGSTSPHAPEVNVAELPPIIEPTPHDIDLHGPMAAGHWAWRWFPMGGWVYHGSPAWMQRVDQGQDFEVPLGRHVIAPSHGKCVRHLADGPFPRGFGSPYAVVYITGPCRFKGNFWYIGHCNGHPIVPVGHWFHTGDVLATPNHSLNRGRGWVELGWAPGGYPGRWGNGAKWHWAFSPAKKWSA